VKISGARRPYDCSYGDIKKKVTIGEKSQQKIPSFQDAANDTSKTNG
jgi:hypothetical protein